MGSGEGFDGAAGDESVNGGVGWDPLKNPREDSPLELLESDLRGFEQADTSGGFGNEVIVVVAKLRRVGAGLNTFEVGIPLEFGELDEQPVGEFLRCFE